MPRSHDPQGPGRGMVGACLAVVAVLAVAPGGAVGRATSGALEAYAIRLTLPDGWREADARMTTSDPELAARGDSLFQVVYEKAITPDAGEPGEPDRATLIVTVQKGPRPFATGPGDLKRVERDLRENMGRPGDEYRQVDRVAATRLAGGDPAIEGWLSGRIGGRAYHQRLLLCTGERYSYMLVFQGHADAWPRLQGEWDQLVAGVALTEPYPWPDSIWSMRGSALIVAGMVILGLVARGRMIRRRGSGRPD